MKASDIADEREATRAGRTRVIWVVASIIVAGLGLYGAPWLLKLYKEFSEKNITSEKSQVLLEISRTHGDELAVASPLKTVEIFSKSDERWTAWGWLYLGTTTSEIRVPASYRFHIKLSGLGPASIEKGVLIVQAPEIVPTLPVAYDSALMEKRTSSGWSRFDGQEQLAALEKDITPALAENAKAQIKNIRDVARNDIQSFIQKWMVQNNPSFSSKIQAIKVVFPDEKPEAVQSQVAIP